MLFHHHTFCNSLRLNVKKCHDPPFFGFVTGATWYKLSGGEKNQNFTKLSFSAGSSSSLASLALREVEGEQKNNRCMQMITNCIVRMISKQAKALFYSPVISHSVPETSQNEAVGTCRSKVCISEAVK